MKRKLLALLMFVVMLFSTASMTACNDSGKIKPDFGKLLEEVPAGGYDNSEVTIRFYHTMGTNLKPILERYIGVFNQIYPNIHVEQEAIGGYDDVRDQIKTQLTTGLNPHIAYCYPDHVALYNVAGKVQPLDVLINSTEADALSGGVTGLTEAQIADFIPAYYEEGREFADGQMYTLPMSKSTEVLYYNATFFAEHDLKVPTTWDEMAELCRKIKAIDPNCYPLGYDSESNWFITMCEQLDSPYTSAQAEKPEDHFLFDNEANHNFIKTLRGWYKEGLFTTQELYGAYTSGLFVQLEEGKQRSYMSIGSSAGATHQRPKANDDGSYPFEVGIAPIPQWNADNQKVISQGPSLCIFQKTNPQEVLASWLFVKFLTTNVAFQATFSMESGYVPVIQSVSTNETYAGWLNGANGGDKIAALSVKVCLEQKDNYYTSPAFNGSSEARDQVGALLRKCITHTDDATADATIAKAFADAIAECVYAAS